MNVLAITGTHIVPQRGSPPPATSQTLRQWFAMASGRVALIGALAFVAYAVWLFMDPWPSYRRLIADLWHLPFFAAASVACWSTSRIAGFEPRLRRAYRLGALALFCATLGNAWSFVMKDLLGRSASIGSVTDVVYLVSYPLLFAALLAFPQVARTRSELIKLALDVGTVVLVGLAAVWHFVIEPALANPTLTPVATILTVVYPVADIVLLFGSAFALLHRPAPESRGALALVASAGLVVFLTDVTYGHVLLRDGHYTSGNPIDLGWQLAALLCFLAAQYQRFSTHHRSNVAKASVHYRGMSLLPYLAVAAGFALLARVAIPILSSRLALGVATVACLTIFVIVRQFLTVREIARLVAERSSGEHRFRALVQHSSDVISVLDHNGVLTFVSPAVGRVFHWRVEELVGREITSLMHPDDIAGARAFMRKIAHEPGDLASSFVCRFLDGDGKWRHVESMCSSLRDDPAVGGLVLNTRDVSDRMRLEAELTRRAYNDPLTGLSNRARFHALTDAALHRRRTAHAAVIYLDLDNFKTINDSLGHLHGDQLLIEFAARLLNATRGCDTVSRLGGDEFALLLEGLNRDEDVIPVVERITSAMQKPFRLGSAEIVIGASIGIAHARPGATAEVLLRDADVAMYVAKREGKGRYTIFQPEMQHAVRNSQEMESDLRAAVDRNEFEVVYQPIVDLRDGRVVSAEALVRWNHPVRGRLSPQVFIGTAIESGLIVPIGRIVLQTACQQLAQWRRQHPQLDELSLSVNVAGRQFQSDAFPRQVAAAIESTGIPADRLVLEITESEIMRDTHLTLTRLHTLKTLGVRIAIDDFGTGYSSLSYLQRFPVDVLKIDKSFIDQVSFNGHGQSLARMIIGLGDTLGMQTIAEGIEDAQQSTALREMQCEFAQGYYFAAPAAPDEFLRRVLTGHQSPSGVGPASRGWSDASALDTGSLVHVAA